MREETSAAGEPAGGPREGFTPAERVAFQDAIRTSERRTWAICGAMLLFTWILVFAVGVILNQPPVFTGVLALILGGLYVWISSRNSVKAVIRATGARPANMEDREEKLLTYRVEEMALAAGLPVPDVYVQESKDPNAFAAGLTPEDAIVCVTTGGLDMWDQEELEGVIAHEMAHVLNRDVRLSTITVGVVGAVAMLSEIVLRSLFWGGGRRSRDVPPALYVVAILAVILAPIFTRLTYLAMSRNREYLADATAVRLTRNPEGLAGALNKIFHDPPDDPKGSRTAAALYIANPWKRLEKTGLWSTHPPLPERIKRVRGMG